MKKIGVLISGGGTNLQALIDKEPLRKGQTAPKDTAHEKR